MDKSVRVWDSSGRQLFTFQPDGPEDGFPSEVAGLGISPDGSQLVTIPIEGWIKVWDTSDYHMIQEYQGPIFGAYNGAQAAFSADGRYLAVGLAAGTGDVSLWQVADGKLLWRGGFMAFAFSPDSQFFAHTEILPGDVLTEQVIISSADGQNVVQSIAKPYKGVMATMIFSPDSKLLALARANSEIQIWRLDKSQLVATYQASCP
jgi:WD40 repeat protein